MKLYVQFMIILVFSFLGEAISTIFHLPIPGSIIGLILLFLALEFKLIRLRHIHTVGNFLLANMTILFLPAAVGIMERFDAIKDYLLPTYHRHFRRHFFKYLSHWFCCSICEAKV